MTVQGDEPGRLVALRLFEVVKLMSKQRARERKKKKQRERRRLSDEVQPGDYVVVAPDGTAVPLGPEIFGDDWPRARQYLSEIDRSELPSVEQAQERQAAKLKPRH